MSVLATYFYLGFRVDLHGERHVTIYAPDGACLVAGARMSDSSVRAFVLGYRREERRERQLERQAA